MRLTSIVLLLGLTGSASCALANLECVANDSSCNPILMPVFYDIDKGSSGAGTTTYIQGYTSGFGFYQSTGGGTWEYTTYSGPSSNLQQVVKDGATLLGIDASTTDTVWRSTDGGLTWTASTVSMGSAPAQITHCNGTTLVVNLSAPVNGWFSTDAGANWTAAATVVQAGGGFASFGLFCNGANFYALTNAGSSTDGAYSADSGNNWTTFSGTGTPATIIAGASDGTNKVYIENASGLQGHSGGATNATFSTTNSIYGGTPAGDAAIVHDGVQFRVGAYNGTTCGFYSSPDNTAWTNTTAACSASMVVRAGSVLNSSIYFGGGESGSTPRVFASHDGGTSFAEETLPAQSTEILDFVIY